MRKIVAFVCLLASAYPALGKNRNDVPPRAVTNGGRQR